MGEGLVPILLVFDGVYGGAGSGRQTVLELGVLKKGEIVLLILLTLNSTFLLFALQNTTDLAEHY